MTSPAWFNSLGSVARRERVFAAMRKLGAESECYYENGRQLAPPHGSVAVGGGSFEQTLKGEVVASYLRAIRHGHTPLEALALAAAERTRHVEKWNTSRGRDYVVHRAEDAEQALLIRVHTTIEEAAR